MKRPHRGTAPDREETMKDESPALACTKVVKEKPATNWKTNKLVLNTSREGMVISYSYGLNPVAAQFASIILNPLQDLQRSPTSATM